MGFEPTRGVARQKSLDIDEVFSQKYMGGKDMTKSLSSFSGERERSVSRSGSRRRGRRPSRSGGTMAESVPKLMDSFHNKSDDEDDALLLNNTNHSNTSNGHKRKEGGERSRRAANTIDISGSKPSERSRRGRRSIAISPKRERSRRGTRSINVDKTEKPKSRKEGKSGEKERRQRTNKAKSSPRSQNEADVAVLQFDPASLVPAPSSQTDGGTCTSDDDSQRQSYLTGVAQFAPGPVRPQDSLEDNFSGFSEVEFTDNTEASGRSSRRKKNKSRSKRNSLSNSMPDLAFEPSHGKKERRGKRRGARESTSRSNSDKELLIQGDDLSSDEETENERSGESFNRRRNRRRNQALNKSPARSPKAPAQFELGERRPSMAGNVGHTPYDDMISELESEAETDREENQSRRPRVKLFNSDDLDVFSNMPADDGKDHARVGAEFEKVKSAVISMEESDTEKKAGKKNKGLRGIGRFFKKKGNDGEESDHESVSSRSSRASRVFKGPLKHSLLLDDESDSDEEDPHF